jgi:hypothetical protein
MSFPSTWSNGKSTSRNFCESASSEQRNLVFFDPDKGLKTDAISHGRARKVEYLYLDELEAAFKRGPSVLVIQFLPFAKASEFVDKVVRRIFHRLNVGEIATFRTPNVVFFLIPQAQHSKMLRERSNGVTQVWHSEIRVVWHLQKAQGRDETTPSEE